MQDGKTCEICLPVFSLIAWKESIFCWWMMCWQQGLRLFLALMPFVAYPDYVSVCLLWHWQGNP
jgi:Predicted amidophosphoribosyltransferases